MSGWGTSLTGLSSTLGILDSLRMDFDDGVIYVAGPTVRYGVHHELGTSKMEARPFAKPATERVSANLLSHIQEISSSQNIDLVDEDDIVRVAALAVQNEMRRTADAKDIRDTGALIASISIEKVD